MIVALRWCRIKDFYRTSKSIIGFDPTQKDGFYLICKDDRGIYRTHTNSKTPNCLKIKHIMDGIFR